MNHIMPCYNPHISITNNIKRSRTVCSPVNLGIRCSIITHFLLNAFFASIKFSSKQLNLYIVHCLAISNIKPNLYRIIIIHLKTFLQCSPCFTNQLRVFNFNTIVSNILIRIFFIYNWQWTLWNYIINCEKDE